MEEIQWEWVGKPAHSIITKRAQWSTEAESEAKCGKLTQISRNCLLQADVVVLNLCHICPFLLRNLNRMQLFVLPVKKICRSVHTFQWQVM